MLKLTMVIIMMILKGVIMESKSGRRALLADRIIDCTGDADVAHLAGAEYRMSDKKDRMGLTTVFNCAGVNKEKFLEYTDTNPATYKVCIPIRFKTKYMIMIMLSYRIGQELGTKKPLVKKIH